MRKFNCTNIQRKQLIEVYGDTLIKIGREEMTEEELDHLLKTLITFLDNLVGLDVKVVQESLNFLEDKRLNKIQDELNQKLERMKKMDKQYTNEEV